MGRRDNNKTVVDIEEGYTSSRFQGAVELGKDPQRSSEVGEN